MPDWRREEDYAFTESLDDHGWAWEFLRRNGAYRKNWHEALDLFRSFVREHGEEEARARLCLGGTTDPEHPDFLLAAEPAPKDKALPPQTTLAPTAIVVPFDVGIPAEPLAPGATALVARWGITCFVNPANDSARVPFMDPRHSISRVISAAPGTDVPRPHLIYMRPGQFAALFDFGQPLEPQWEEVLETVRFMRDGSWMRSARLLRPLPRRHPRKWTRYLRLLDGRAAGASYETLADAIFASATADRNSDPIKRVDDTLQQAREMLKPSRYLRILGSAAPH